MAWGTRYRETFDTLDGVHSYQIDFKFKAYAGAVTEVDLAHPFLVLQYGSGGTSSLMKWDMASQAEVIVHDDSSSTFRTAISECDEDEVILEVTRDSVLFWAGFVKSEIQSKPLNDTDRNVVVRASCGIDLSQGRAYDNSGTNYTGREKLSVVLSRALAKIGVDLGIASNHLACNWYPFRASSDITGDPLNTVEGDQTWLLADTGATYSAYTVMKEVASRFGMRIMQVAGKWYVTQPHLTRGASYTAYEYDTAGTAVTSDSVSTVTPIVIGSGAAGANDIELTVDGEITGASALRKSKTKYIHGLRDDILIENGSFEEATAGEPDNWTASASGAGAVYARGYNSTYSLAFDSTAYTTGAVANLATKHRIQSAGYINADTQMQLSAMFRAYKVDAEGEGTWVNSRLTRPMFWSIAHQDLSGNWTGYDDTTETWTSVISGVYFKNRVDALPHSWNALKRIVAAPGTPGRVYLLLWQGVDTVDLGSSSFEIDKFLWDLVSLTPLPVGEAVTAGIETTLENTGASNSKTNEAGEFIFGDGPSEVHISRLTFDDSGVDVPTSGWQAGPYSGGASTEKSIDYLWNYENLVQGRVIQKRLIATLRLKGTADYLPHQPLSYNGSQYACTHYRLDAYRRKVTVDCVETLATASVTATEWTVIVKDALNIANTVTSDFTTSLDNASSVDNVAITTAPYAIGEITQLDVEPLEKGLEYGSLLVVVPPDGGFVPVKLAQAAAAGAEILTIEAVYLSKVLRYPAGVKLTEAEIRSAFIKTQESISLLVEGGPVCTSGVTLTSGARISLTVSEVMQVVRSGETLTIVPTDGSDPIYLVLSADTAIGDTSVSFASNTFAVAAGDPIYGGGNATAELLIESNRITAEISKEGEQYGLLSSGISSSTTIGIKAPGIAGDLKVGDTLLHQRISTGKQSVLTVAANASSGATSITVDANSVVGDEDDALTPGAIVGLRVGFDGIQIEGPALYSTNFDGTFDASWNITARGNTGWALTKAGHFAATNVLLSGAIVITGGSGIANLADAGALAVVDDLSGVPDGGGFVKTTTNEAAGAGYAYTGLDASGNLTTSALPTSSIGNPGVAGLYMGADYFGYHNGNSLASGWQTMMTSGGNFYLGGTSGSLTWASSTLSIAGNISMTGASSLANATLTISGTGKIVVGTMALGYNVSGTDDGLFIDSENYWYTDGHLLVGDKSEGKYLEWTPAGRLVIAGDIYDDNGTKIFDAASKTLSNNALLETLSVSGILSLTGSGSLSLSGCLTINTSGINLSAVSGNIYSSPKAIKWDNGPTIASYSPGTGQATDELVISNSGATAPTITVSSSAVQLVASGNLFLNNSGTGNTTIGNATGATTVTGSIGLSTVTSGTWQGSVVQPTYGGTGLTSISTLLNSNVTPTSLGLLIGTNTQAYSLRLTNIAALTDPGADRLLFWDDSASAVTWLTLGSGLSIVSTEIRAEVYKVNTGVGVETALYIPSTTQHASAGSLYGYIVYDMAGTLKKIPLYDIS